MSIDDFNRMKENAFREAIKTHNSRTAMPPVPDFVRIPESAKPTQSIETDAQKPTNEAKSTPKPSQKRINSLINYINIPELLKNSDSALLLGLIFLLWGESADETLILALAYILL